MATRKKKLQQCYDLECFKRNADQADAWIAMREAALASDDVGSTLEGVEAAQKKLLDFEKSLGAQKEKIANIMQEADTLLASPETHYDAENIEARKADVSAR